MICDQFIYMACRRGLGGGAGFQPMAASAGIAYTEQAELERLLCYTPSRPRAGAMVQARIERLVYGADDPKGGAVSSCFAVLDHPQLSTFNPLKFYILRGDETLYGHVQVPTATAQTPAETRTR